MLFWSKIISAQDIHFTMFHSVPVLMNPSSAGMFESGLRASVNYKSQWGSISTPFNTFAFTVDGVPVKKRNGKSFIGLALGVFKDVAGVSNFGITKVDLTVSSIIHLSKLQTASLGFTSGWGQSSLQPNKLEWDSQFNGQFYDPSLSSNESYDFNNKQFFDFSTGISWAYGKPASTLSSNDRFNAQAGIAMHHVSKPEFVLYTSKNERLYSKFAIHANFHFLAKKTSKIALRPRFQVFIQGPSSEVNIGLIFAYLIQDGSKYTKNKKGYALNFGAYYRLGDSFSPSVEFELGSLTIGYAYDTNISGLTKASYGMGGSEIFLKFQSPNNFLKFSNQPTYI